MLRKIGGIQNNLSVKTVAPKIEDIGCNIFSQLSEEI
jgi:hypothetical protein